MFGLGIDSDMIKGRVRACDYLTVAQLFLQDNFLLDRPLSFEDIKPRLLGHWGTCHGINVAYANLKAFFDGQNQQNGNYSQKKQNTMTRQYQPIANKDDNFQFILGPGHGFPALQANLFLDGELLKIDSKAKRNLDGIKYICKNFSWPDGFPSHASPMTPGVISEGGELGYALGIAYGAALGHPERTIAVLLGDGEFETATALSSMNLVKLFGTPNNGKVLPILHLNGYKISAPTIYARKSERELMELIRGFGYELILVNGDDIEEFQNALARIQNYYAKFYNVFAKNEVAFVKNQSVNAKNPPFIIMKTEKGETGPEYVKGQKVEGNYLAHQIPLKEAKTDKNELDILEKWLKSYHFEELFSETEGFSL